MNAQFWNIFVVIYSVLLSTAIANPLLRVLTDTSINGDYATFNRMQKISLSQNLSVVALGNGGCLTCHDTGNWNTAYFGHAGQLCGVNDTAISLQVCCCGKDDVCGGYGANCTCTKKSSNHTLLTILLIIASLFLFLLRFFCYCGQKTTPVDESVEETPTDNTNSRVPYRTVS